MNPAHVHLVLNHVPLVATLLGILVMGLARLRASADMTCVAFGVFVLGAVVTIPVYLTGEPAEEIVEPLAGVLEPAIHTHEEAAKISMTPMMLLGLISVIGLVLMWRHGAAPRWLVWMSLALALVTAGLMARTANLGGMIHHFELRGPESAASER